MPTPPRRASGARRGRPPVTLSTRILSRREPCPRRALAAAVADDNSSYAALSRMIQRPDDYLARFVREGHPRALSADEHRCLATFFGLDDRGLGVRELWKGDW